jgi:hypothetical protein
MEGPEPFRCPLSERFQSQAMLLARAIDGPLPEPSDKAGAQT